MTLSKVFFYHIHGNVKSLRPSLFIVSEGRSEYSVTVYYFSIIGSKESEVFACQCSRSGCERVIFSLSS